MRISLTNLEFLGFHGLYEAEKKIGNTFKVDVIIDFTPTVEIVDQLDQTIDYVKVFDTVKSVMSVPTPLLETLVGKIADQVLLEHPIAEKVFVSITKQKLPIPFFEGDTTVSIEKLRK
jgi:7,8-dihydroneopterin aldolase/epimerase/oxygenase